LINGDSLTKLKANRNTIADNWEEVDVAAARAVAFQQAVAKLTAYGTGVLTGQSLLSSFRIS
jgi:hypothetical protein